LLSQRFRLWICLFCLSIRAWVFTVKVSPSGFSLLYDMVLHKCSLVLFCLLIRAWVFTVYYTGLAFLLQARDFLLCTKRSCTNVPWFSSSYQSGPFKGPKKSQAPRKSLDFVQRDHLESLKWSHLVIFRGLIS
jgi:hypothetical protein